MKTETFLKLNYEFLDKDYTLSQATILSYLKSFQEQNKYCYQSKSDIAKRFNFDISTINRTIKSLIDKGVIFTSQDKKYLKAAFNNRKALILVDDKNPLPTIEETKADEETTTSTIEESTVLIAQAFTGQTETTEVIPSIPKAEESVLNQIEIAEEENSVSTEEDVIPQLEPKFSLPGNLHSLYWEDEENIQWLQKYMLDGYKIEGVLEPNLKIRLENYKDKYLLEN
jgi:Mn-dependent DtxR family transcriptional regulator